MRTQEKAIYTIGHSNRDVESFIALLKAHQIKKVIDIRTIPKSRHNPQFNQDTLKESLKEHWTSFEIKVLSNFWFF